MPPIPRHVAVPPALRPHPQYAKVAAVLSVASARATPLRGTYFRFMTPKFAKTANAVSGVGGFLGSGRWNPAGCFNLLNASETGDVAFAEVLSTARYYRLPIKDTFPKVVTTLDVDLQFLLDLTDRALLRALGTSGPALTGCDFRAENRSGREAITQAIGRAAFAAGFEALLVPSAQTTGARNLVAFPQNLQPGSVVTPQGLEVFDPL